MSAALVFSQVILDFRLFEKADRINTKLSENETTTQ